MAIPPKGFTTVNLNLQSNHVMSVKLLPYSCLAVQKCTPKATFVHVYTYQGRSQEGRLWNRKSRSLLKSRVRGLVVVINGIIDNIGLDMQRRDKRRDIRRYGEALCNAGGPEGRREGKVHKSVFHLRRERLEADTSGTVSNYLKEVICTLGMIRCIY